MSAIESSSFALVFFANTGARGGACVESSSYRGANQVIAYKDCHVHLLRDVSGIFTFKLEVVQRYLKGRRDDENDKYVISQKTKDEALDRPVLRMASSNGAHESRALTFATLRDQIVALGKRVGYRDIVKIYAIRAGVANKIKDPPQARRAAAHHISGELGCAPRPTPRSWYAELPTRFFDNAL
ncbi:hypothetical protein V502_02315, partial [Pseudogymnoascus sp. VKM F-4520 (FW-2644)]